MQEIFPIPVFPCSIGRVAESQSLLPRPGKQVFPPYFFKLPLRARELLLLELLGFVPHVCLSS